MQDGPRERARCALEGLSIGDALGHSLQWCAERVPRRSEPPPPWSWSDDTEMALSVVATLEAHGSVEQDDLARRFARDFHAGRMYGPVWAAALHLGDFAEALWFTLGALGDLDTNAAIVGGVVASYVGEAGIPPRWRRLREPLPGWGRHPGPAPGLISPPAPGPRGRSRRRRRGP